MGGLGTALGQVFRRDYYSQRLGASFNIPLYNRQAQGDYGIEQLQLRQGDLIERRNMNAILVAISNQMIALRQARARYSQAADTRALQEQLLEKEQQMFNFGGATIADVVAARTTLLAAQLTEVEALAAYGRARVALDQTLGETLEVNHISIERSIERACVPVAHALPACRVHTLVNVFQLPNLARLRAYHRLAHPAGEGLAELGHIGNDAVHAILQRRMWICDRIHALGLGPFVAASPLRHADEEALIRREAHRWAEDPVLWSRSSKPSKPGTFHPDRRRLRRASACH